MNVKELIDKLDGIRAKYGDDTEICAWGDEAARIGISARVIVGRCKTAEYLSNGKWDAEASDKWSKLAKQFNAIASIYVGKDGEDTVFLRDIANTSIDL